MGLRVIGGHSYSSTHTFSEGIWVHALIKRRRGGEGEEISLVGETGPNEPHLAPTILGAPRQNHRLHLDYTISYFKILLMTQECVSVDF